MEIPEARAGAPRFTFDDLLIALLCAIEEYGDNMNLKLSRIKAMHEKLAEVGGLVKIGYNPCPDGESVIITGLIGEAQISEWMRVENMLTHRKVGSA